MDMKITPWKITTRDTPSVIAATRGVPDHRSRQATERFPATASYATVTFVSSESWIKHQDKEARNPSDISARLRYPRQQCFATLRMIPRERLQ